MNNNKKCCDAYEIDNNDMETATHLNGARSSVADLSATELGEVRMSAAAPAATTSRQNGSGSCQNGPCKTSMALHSKPESPWHSLKTVFLVSFIIALILWIIVYTLLSQYDLL